MNIPPRPDSRSGNSYTQPHSSSFMEGLAASYKRSTMFDPVDTRARKASAGREENESQSIVAEGVTSLESSITQESSTTHQPPVDTSANESTRLISKSSDVDESVRAPVSKSTTVQTIFNITNLLIGIGLLSLPLGFRLAGWLLGLVIVALGALITGYTAVLLARALETKPEAYAYSDIGTMAYGGVMSYITGLIFMLELTAAGSAMTILFSDNFGAVLPGVSSSLLKVICFAIMLPATLVPLRILSYASVVGILSTVVLILVVFFDGIYLPVKPGSLRDPMPTSALPSSWTAFPLSVGLLMASFGGHGIFPQVYTDMQHRRHFPKSIWIAYGFSTAICTFTGIIGYLMFGENVASEITISLLNTPGYPKVLNKMAIVLTAVAALTKIPMTTKSISANIDLFLGLKTLNEEKEAGSKRFGAYLGVRLLVNSTIFAIAFFFPSFDRMMSVLGSAFVFLISVILPTLFYIRIMDKTKERLLSAAVRMLLWILVVMSTIVAIICTTWAFLPLKT